jgi:rare lipoprotein A
VVDRGIASWYGTKFHGRRTANGEVYDMNALTAAHKTLPFGSVVEVVNLDNGRSVTVRINDRGPFVRGRVIDLSRGAAKQMGLIGAGLANVEVVLITPPQPDHYALQAGAFRDATRAQALQSRLASVANNVQVHSQEGWHRVLVGPFETYDQAREVRRNLARQGYELVIRRLPVGGG